MPIDLSELLSFVPQFGDSDDTYRMAAGIAMEDRLVPIEVTYDGPLGLFLDSNTEERKRIMYAAGVGKVQYGGRPTDALIGYSEWPGDRVVVPVYRITSARRAGSESDSVAID